MLPSLLKIDAVARAVERDLALLAAALRADASVDGGTEALFLALVADGTGHPSLIMARSVVGRRSSGAARHYAVLRKNSGAASGIAKPPGLD